MLATKHYDTAVDLWSLGIVMIEATRGLKLKKNFPWAFENVGINNCPTKDNLPPYQGKCQYPASPRQDEKD